MVDPRTLFGPSARRRASLAVVMWVFGLATTTLLIGMWGRTVSTDQATLEEGTRAVVEAEVIANRVEDWVASGIASSTDGEQAAVAAALADIGETPQAHDAVATIAEQAVQAALAEPGERIEIDVRTALAPLAPVIGERLRASGVAAPQEQVDAVIAGVPDLVLGSGVAQQIGGAATRATAFLTRVVLIAGLVLALSGGAAYFLSEDRLKMLRTLAIRIAISALTFAVVLRVGAWALDPDGGRSPVASGGAVLLRSNGWLLPLLAAINVGVAVVITSAVRRRRHDTHPTPSGTPSSPHPSSPRPRLRTQPADDRIAG